MAEHEQGDSHGGHGGGGGHGAGAHGGGAHEEHEGAPEWLISFADNVALLMGFFVILLAMNMNAPKPRGGIGSEDGSGNDDRMMDFVIAVRAAFNNPFDINSDNPAEQAFIKRLLEKQGTGGGDGDGNSDQPSEAGQNEESQASRPTEYSGQGGTVPFDDNSASLGPHARGVAEAIGRQLRGMRWVIEVRGHASPAETRQEPEKGIALSHRRAIAVAQALVEQGLRWDQINIVACGANDPKVARSGDQALEGLNQRVDVVVTGTPLRELGPGKPAARPAPAAEPDPEH